MHDETLLTSGEQQNGMDKYADIEQWPGEYIGLMEQIPMFQGVATRSLLCMCKVEMSNAATVPAQREHMNLDLAGRHRP